LRFNSTSSEHNANGQVCVVNYAGGFSGKAAQAATRE
jgi:hypothetical protein